MGLCDLQPQQLGNASWDWASHIHIMEEGNRAKLILQQIHIP